LRIPKLGWKRGSKKYDTQWFKPVIPATQEIRRIMVQIQMGQKVHENSSKPAAGQGGAHLSSQLSINKRITVQASLGIKQEPISKMTKATGAGAWLKW
jgi:hypothetical protein